ncbi:MAG: hypothetical protein ABSH20_20010 [Tepidisphaeraceae bacterium]|jgi:hypothetical protein
MSNTTPLSELIEQLHDVNRQLSEAARPLDRLSELNFQQRSQLGDQIRAALKRWEMVTEQIGHALSQE